MRFLVVDDSGTMRRIIINTLNKLGYTECAEATNGAEGIDRVTAGGIDFVITDWNMPVMNGIDLVKSIRSSPASQKLPVMMVTTNAAQEDIVAAVSAGINNYVVKPFTPDTMKEKIASVLASCGK